MVLQKTNIPVSLGLGLDTKTDKHQVQGSLLEIENMQVRKTKSIDMRFGYDQFSNTTADGYQIEDALNVAAFNDELTLLTSSKLYSFSSGSEVWADKSVLITASVGSAPVIANSFEQSSCDLAVTREIAIYAWEDSRGGCRGAVKDLSSGAILIADTALNAFGSRPRCFALQNYLFVFYYDSDNQALIARRVDASNATSFTDEVTVGVDINATYPYFDVCLSGTSRMIVAYNTNSNELKLAYYLQNNTVGSTLQGVPDPTSIAGVNPNSCLSIFPGQPVGTTETFHVAWGNSSDGISTMGFYANFTEYKPEVVVDAYQTDARNIAGISYSDSVDLFWEVADAYIAMDNYIETSTLTVSTNVAADPDVMQRAGGIGSKPFFNGSTSILVSFQSESGLQDTYFIVNKLGQIEGKIAPQTAGGHTFRDSNAPGAWVHGNDTVFATRKKTRAISVSGGGSAVLSNFYQSSINYNDVAIGQPFQLGMNLHIPGGYIKQYDGQSVTEHNFHLYPEDPDISEFQPGAVQDGAYQYIVIFEWVDAQGQISRSQTSIPTDFTVTGGPSENQLLIPTLRYTDKKEPIRTPVIISVYRNEKDGGSIFYRVSDDDNPVYNDVTANNVAFYDNVSDADLISRPLLYTTGGVLDDAPGPACRVVRTAKNRLFAVGLENPNDVAFTKPYVVGEAVAFADEFRQTIDAKGGRLTAIAEMDDKVILFKENTLFYLTGDGPNDLGEGNFFVTPIIAPVGCSEPESIVETPLGVMFKSNKGIWLLDRGLQTSYIGAPVEDYNDLNISSAQIVADLNQVRFTTEEGRTLVYDYYFSLWYTFTNQQAISAINWQGSYLFARPDGLVWRENRESYSDVNVPIIPKLVTQWFSLAQLQGFQRVYSGQLLGEYKGSHQLILSVAYDYLDSNTEEFTFDMDSNGFNETYGEDSPYGNQELYGGFNGLYQFKFSPRQQKCEAMKITITANFPESEGNAAYSLSAITLEVGTKKGLNKLPTSRAMVGT